MAVFRVEKNRNYTVMSNYHLKDKNLSLKSKGLLSVILSLPEEWNYTTRGLAAISKEGVDSIGTALKELETVGYLTRNKLRDEKGRITDTEYIIYECPQQNPNTPDSENPSTPKPNPPLPNTPLPNTPNPSTPHPYTEKPYMDNQQTATPHTDLPHTKNPAQLNTNQTNPNELNPYALNIHQSIAQSYPQQGSYPQPASYQQPTQPQPQRQDKMDSMDSYNAYLEIIRENIEYESLCEQHKHHVQEIDEIVDLMLEVACSNKKTIRIGGDDKPTALVKSRILKLDFSHIEYVMDCMNKNTTDIRNIKSYLLTTIYNAPYTIDSYYKAAVNHDFYGKK